MKGCWKICFLLTTLIAASLEESVKEIFKHFNDKGYDKTQRPFKDEKPVEVTIQVMVWSIASVNEFDFTFDISYLLNTWWMDPRLKHDNNSISFSDSPEDHIWFPNMMLTNSDNNERVGKDLVTEIAGSGAVYVSQRMKAKCTCVMELSTFPMDTQHCPLSMESYAYSAKDLNLGWHQQAILINDGFAISGYEYDGFNHEKLSLNYTMGSETYLWDQIVVKLALRRNLPYYIYRIYVPSILLMVFTVGSYWIPATDDDSGRVGSIVTTFLAMIFVLQSVTEEVAKTSTATSLHIFVIVNIIFVVLSIIVYLLVSKTKKRSECFDWCETTIKNRLKINKSKQNNDTPLPERNVHAAEIEVAHNDLANTNANGEDVSFILKDENEVHYLDKICRYLMPLLYLIFIVTHFAHYLTVSHLDKK